MSEQDVEMQANALMTSAGVRARDDLMLVRLRGDDQRSWLNGQVTNDVRNTKAGDSVYCLAVTVRGKIMADLWVLDFGDDQLGALLPRSAADAVLESFDRQIIMEDVELERDTQASVISVQGPRASDVVAALPDARAFDCDELGAGGRFVLVASAERDAALSRLAEAARAQAGGPVDEAGFELARLRAAVPRFGRDFGEKTYPQEVGLKARAVSFSKGCYLGQEVVCTLENRGRLSRRLARLEVIEGSAAIDDELHDAQGATAGRVTSLAYDPSLGRARAFGYIKTAAATADSILKTADAQLVVTGLVGDA